MLANFQKAINYVNLQSFSDEIVYDYQKRPIIIPTQTQLSNLINNYNSFILQAYDPVYGGFGNGQKFPQPGTLFLRDRLPALSVSQQSQPF